MHDLMPKELWQSLPPLYSQERVKNPQVKGRYCAPDGALDFFAVEFDGEDTFFGLIVGPRKITMGYMSLTGMAANGVSRDETFKEQDLDSVRDRIRLHLGV